MHYHSGAKVELGDIVAVGGADGPQTRVVVIVPDRAAEGFDVDGWAHLGPGILLQDTSVFGLVWVSQLDHEYILVRRA